MIANGSASPFFRQELLRRHPHRKGLRRVERPERGALGDIVIDAESGDQRAHRRQLNDVGMFAEIRIFGEAHRTSEPGELRQTHVADDTAR